MTDYWLVLLLFNRQNATLVHMEVQLDLLFFVAPMSPTSLLGLVFFIYMI